MDALIILILIAALNIMQAMDRRAGRERFR